MENFDNAVNRIKNILKDCDNNEHHFVVEVGGCVDCSSYPEIEFEGDCGSVATIGVECDGTIKVYGNTEYDSFEVNIEELSYNEVCGILTTMEEQLDMEVSPKFVKETFSITSLCRDDITALGFKGAETISDEIMEKIAEKMCNAYVEHSFWENLDYFVKEYCNLEEVKPNEE